MRQYNYKAQGITGYGQQFAMTIGIVKDNADPLQNGRLKVYVPAYDPVDFKVEDLPWAIYVSPFGGSTSDFKAGPEQETIPGITAYGFWSIPKNGAQVLIGCLDGNQDARFYMGCIFMPEHNRTIPHGVNGISSDIDESGVYPQKVYPHAEKRLQEAGLGPDSAHFKTRGGYERSISYPANKGDEKKPDNGYAPKPLEPTKRDSQVHAWTTPGRHSILMTDVDDNCRIRIKTTNGSQVIFDDTNERIYISTGRGKSYVELDEGNGKIYVYSDSKINVRAKGDLNLYSDENINIKANKRVHIESEDRSVHITAKQNITAKSTHADFIVQASRAIKLKTFDGPNAPQLGEQLIKGTTPLDKKYRFAEKGGSGTSTIELDGAQGVYAKGEQVKLTATGDVNMVGSSVKMTGSTVHFDASAAKWRGGISTGLIDSRRGAVTAVAPASPAKHYDGHIVLTFPYIGDANGLPKAGHPGTMLKPDHEPWVRDEDSAWVPDAPRNAKYKP